MNNLERASVMRILVMLHPTSKRGTKTPYTKLRKFLIADGYLMLQPELFMRIGTNRKGIEKHLRRIQEFNPGTGVVRILKLTEKQKSLFEYIKINGETTLKKACYCCGLTSVVAKNLEKLGLIEIFDKHVYKDPYKDVEKTRNVEDIILNYEQNVAKEGILSFIKKKEFKVCLLKGVTGSGKTQVFLKLIDYVIKNGRDCIFLVPEISLTAQLIAFFRSF